MKRTILVSGSSGYVGSHTVKFLVERGDHAVGLDLASPSAAVKRYLSESAVADIRDRDVVLDLCRRHDIHGVIHCAAKCLVGESVEKPDLYRDHNVTRAGRFADALAEAGVPVFVFSSTAATYGEPKTVPIPETHPQEPINPYGETKLTFERDLLSRRQSGIFRVGIVRYFNAAGADPAGEIGEVHDPETHLIPNAIFAALGRRKGFSIFGDDYPTRDGTCERDYISVWDLAQAHRILLERLNDDLDEGVFNLGTGRGYTILEVLDEIDRQTGRKIARTCSPRRAGDPAVLVADASRALRELAWTPKESDLSRLVETALCWHRSEA